MANSLVLWQGTKGHFFEANGSASKCYVMTRQGVRFGERVGVDAQTGKPCRPVTPEMMDRLAAYAQGKRPERVASTDPDFFDLKTGEPNIWYAKNKADEIELYDLMGYQPETGEELQPVTKQIVQDWKSQQKQIAEREPTKIEDPKKFVFFDPKTGNPRGWYWIGPGNAFEFYDNRGYQPRTGDPLKVVTRDVLTAWGEQTAKRCYIVTRETISFGNVIGPDPQTGRECRAFTSALMERLKDYSRGMRPKQITTVDVNFFVLRTGEPNIWYSRDPKGRIKLFDLIGFDPDSGQELLPVSTDIVNAWKRQTEAKSQKPPQIIDPDQHPFFNTVSGESQVWYWRGSNGEWEFYDNPGFRKTGEKLTPVTQDIIENWRRELILQKKQAAERAALAERQRIAAQEALQRAHDAETARTSALQQAEAAKAEEDRQAGGNCDRLAANPTDARRPGDVVGVDYADLKANPQSAIDACLQAVRVYPAELRYKYNLARALEFNAPQRAINIYVELVRQQYAAAYDNFAGLIWKERKDLPAAIKQYEQGVRLGDPSAMVSVAWLIQHGKYSTQNPEATRRSLLVKAAQAGHKGAQETLDSDQQQLQARAYQQQNDQMQQQMMMNLLGGVVRGLAR